MTALAHKRLPDLGAETRAICARVAEQLEADAAELAQTMTGVVIDEIPAYSAMTAPAQREAIYAHSLEHVRAVTRAIRTWSLPQPEELDFVKARAGLRATQQIPLSALLHSYRLGHRTIWERLARLLAEQNNVLDAALALTTLTLSYTDLISAALAEGYVEQQRGMLLQVARARRDLLDNILQGTFDQNSDTFKLASSFALVPGGDFLVVVMNRASSSPGDLSGDVESRAAETLRRHLSLGVAQPFVVVRQGEVVSIAPLARARPSAIAHLVRLAHTELGQQGVRWSAGISTICAGLGEVARGYQEALQAFGSLGAEAGVYALLEQRVHDYVVQHADRTAVRMIPPACRRLLESVAPGDRMLVETLHAYAQAEMSIRDAADALSVHPNTVSYRLEKLSRMLGRDVCQFSELVEVLTWVKLLG